MISTYRFLATGGQKQWVQFSEGAKIFVSKISILMGGRAHCSKKSCKIEKIIGWRADTSPGPKSKKKTVLYLITGELLVV